MVPINRRDHIVKVVLCRCKNQKILVPIVTATKIKNIADIVIKTGILPTQISPWSK